LRRGDFPTAYWMKGNEKMAKDKYPKVIHMTPEWAAWVAEPTECAGLPDGKWVPARSLGYPSILMRFKCAWLVWTGKADALIWPGQ
jgi:hypothetical protein